MGSLKIGVALWSLGNPGTFPEWEKLLDVAASTGVKAVQPWSVDEKKWKVVCALDPDRCATPKQRADVRKACEKRGLEISGFCAQLAGPTDLGGFGDDDTDVKSRVEKTIRALQMAVDIGSPIVTTHIGPIPEDAKNPIYGRFIKNIATVMKDADKRGGVFALETGQETATTLKRFIEDVGAKNLKVNYDPANMLKHGAVEGVKVLANYIVHTHAKDKHPKTGKPTVGQGDVPWDAYLGELKSIGYKGWFAIEDESEGHGLEILTGEGSVYQSIVSGRKFLENY